MIITIGGDAGSGKSTVAQLVAERLGFKFHSIGNLRRQMASARGMTIEEYNKLGETDPSTDKEADAFQEKLGKTEDNFVLEGRLGWKFIPQSFKVFLAVDEKVAAERILKDHQAKRRASEKAIHTIDEALAHLRARRKTDTLRYKKYYNTDFLDMKHYDLVIDTSKSTVEKVADEILEAARKDLKSEARRGVHMSVKEHDFVELDYTGRLKEGNSVFDTTEERVARDNGMKGKFGRITICLGKGHLLKGLEKKLVGKELGTHHIELSADEAFGKKNGKLMNLIPTQNFIKQGIQPQPGMPVEIDGMMGTVRAVTGGRTIVDFNHPLAGKDVSYDVTLHKIITDAAQKVASLVKVLLNQEPQVTVAKDDVTVSLKEELPKQIADELAKEIVATAGVKHVAFLKA